MIYRALRWLHDLWYGPQHCPACGMTADDHQRTGGCWG